MLFINYTVCKIKLHPLNPVVFSSSILLYNTRLSTLIRANRLVESVVMLALSSGDVGIKYGRSSSPLSNRRDRRGADQKIEGCSLARDGRPSLHSLLSLSSHYCSESLKIPPI